MFMKKIIFTTLLVTGLFAFANAQKGSVLLYGTVGFNSSESDPSGNKASSFSLMPGIGYQFNNNWTVGLAGGVSTMKTEFGLLENKLTGYAVGPFIRYTKTLTGPFAFFTQLDAQYMSTTNKPAGGGEVKTTGFEVGITPAIGINVYKGLALNFSFGNLNYATEKTKGTQNKNSGFGFNFGSQAHIGISKNF